MSQIWLMAKISPQTRVERQLCTLIHVSRPHTRHTAAGYIEYSRK